MNCRKIKLINFQDNFECINFSKINDFNNENKGRSHAGDDFSMPDTVWIVHELDGLNLIKKTAPGSVVVAVIRSEFIEGEILELPFDLKKYFMDEKLMVVLGGEVEEQAALCSSLIDIDKFRGWKPFFEIEIIKKDTSYFKAFYRSLGAKLNVKNLYKNTSIHTTHIFLKNALINAPLMHNKIKISD